MIVDVLKAIRTRRSIKVFDPNYVLPASELEQLLAATTYCPTSYNLQNWRIVRVTDKGARRKIREVASNQAQVTDASELFVICGDLKAWQKDPQRYWAEASEERQHYVLPKIRDFYTGRAWMERDEVMRSGAIVGQTLMLAAKDLGLDSCPMIGFEQEAVAKIIKLPADHALVMMLAVGKAAGPPRPRGSQFGVDYFYRENHF